MRSRLPYLRTSHSLVLTGTWTATLLLTVLFVGCKSKPAPAPEPAAVPQAQVAPEAPAPPSSTVPKIKKHIYDTEANPNKDIAAAVKQARKEKKRIILDFGGDWCGDCQVLDIYFHQAPNAELLERHFVLVHVDIGRMDHNVETAEKYKVPIKKGVPALAVLDSNGKLLFSQADKEFENMRTMQPDSVTEFLNRWKS